MSRITLYLDEDAMEMRLVRTLRSHGLDVLTALEAGMRHHDDEGQLQLAADQGRSLYSFNVGDYLAIHNKWMSAGRSHAGIILSPQRRYSVGEQSRRLVRLVTSQTLDSMCNRVEFLSQWGVR